MIIIGCDYHPSLQQIAFVDTETGELQELRLGASRGSGKVLSPAVGTCEWGWKPVGRPVGLSDC